MTSNHNNYEKRRKEMARGSTPIDIQKRCSKVCAQYLNGYWTTVDAEKLVVKRITGGFTNQLYYCSLPELPQSSQILSDQPKQVAVRFYGKKWFGNYEGNERLNDVIITILASEHKLGPKLYGIFDGGSIEEYIESHQFGLKEQNDPKYVGRLSRMLAQFHSLNVPIARTGNWYFEFLDDFYEKAYQLFPIDDLIKEVNATTFMGINLKEEIEWLKKCLVATSSPIVFSHNDFRGSNILIREFNNDDEVDDSNIIRICDFEYSCYYYRGFDFGALFEDWGRTNFEDTASFPSDQVIEQFMEDYIEECVKIHGENYKNNELNSMKQLVKEAKVFVLAEQMFFIMFILRSEDMPYNLTKKDFLVKPYLLVRGDKRLSHYFDLKKRFKNEGLIPLCL